MAQSKDTREGWKSKPQRMDTNVTPSKRRRIDNPDDSGDWDESFTLTQQELDTLDIIESQAVGESALHPSTSYHPGPDDSHAVSPVQHHPSLFQVPSVAGVNRLKIRTSTSSSSGSSAYPKSESSFSLRKTPSTDCSSAPGSLTTSKSSSSHHSSNQSLSDHSHQVSMPAASGTGVDTNSNLGNIVAMKEELIKRTVEAERLKSEAQKAKSDLYVRDGEVKFLQDMLRRQEAEIEKLREERDNRQEREAQHQKEHEKALKADNERLQTLIEFKSQDCQHLQERCQNLEERLRELNVHGSSISSLQGSPSMSPRKRRMAPGPSKAPEQGGFPSHQSFLSAVDVSGSRSRNFENAETMTESLTLESTLSDRAAFQPNTRHPRLQLRIFPTTGEVTGPQIVSQLLQCSYNPSGDMSERGITGLLQALPSRLDLTELQYTRDLTTSRLSPVKRCFSTESRRNFSPAVPSSVECKAVVPKEHFLYAVEGLRSLLDSEQTEQTLGTSLLEGEPQHAPVKTSLSGCILILPLLNDYLGHYINIISSPMHGGCMSPSSGCSTPNSYESSLESITASLEVLLHEGAEYANNLESLTLSSLKVLRKLLCLNEDVRATCIQSKVIPPVACPPVNTSSSSLDTDHNEHRKTDDSGMEGDDEKNGSSSSTFESPDSIASPAVHVQELNILLKLVRLATPGQETFEQCTLHVQSIILNLSGMAGSSVPPEDFSLFPPLLRKKSKFNKLIVQESLGALTVLAEKSSDLEVGRMYVVFLRGVLTDCLNLDGHPLIWISALQLFAQLVRAASNLPAICSKSDSCTLLSIHMTLIKCLSSPEQFKGQLLSVFHWVTRGLSSIISFHRNGVSLIMENDCRCSAQVIPSLVHAMCRLFQDHRTTSCDDILGALRKGVSLLHAISLGDLHFQHRYSPVHPSYTSLMFDLTLLYKKYPVIPPVEVSALEDLWDYEHDDSDISQDSN